MKKLLALILAVLMLLPVLVACKKDGDDGESVTVTTPVSTDPSRVPPEVKDFGGYEFKMRLDSWDSDYDLAAPEKLTGEGINDTIFNRNKTVEAMYNVKFSANMEQEHDPDASAAFLQNMASSGEYFADFYSQDANQMLSSNAINGYFLNIYDLQSLRLTEAWWDQDFIKELTIDNHAYLLTGDIQVNDDIAQISTMMNLDLYEKTYPEKNIYEIIVKNGAWTFEEFFATWQGFGSSDTGVTGVVDGDDLVGYGYDSATTAYLYMAAGMKSFRMENGQPVLNFRSEKALKIADWMQQILDGNTGFKSAQAEGGGGGYFNYDTIRFHFQGGKLLFVSNNFGDALEMYLDMEDDIIYPPFPKYDLAQERYYSPVHRCFEALAISSNVKDKERSALIAEALCFYSDKLEQEIIDVLLQERLTSELEPREILQTLMRSKTYDMDYFAGVSGFTSAYGTLMKNKALASYATEMQKAEQSAINSRGKGKLQLFLQKYTQY